MEGNRINLVGAILGKRGSGKTYFVNNQLLKEYRKAHPEMKILVVDTLDHPDYFQVAEMPLKKLKYWVKPSMYRIFSSNTDQVMAEIATNLKNCLIIFEDASKYVGRTLTSDMRRFIYDSKQKNLDIIFLFHGFASAPAELFRVIDFIHLFRTDNPEYRKSELVNYDEIKESYDRIMKSSNPYANETIRIY